MNQIEMFAKSLPKHGGYVDSYARLMLQVLKEDGVEDIEKGIKYVMDSNFPGRIEKRPEGEANCRELLFNIKKENEAAYQEARSFLLENMKKELSINA